jgi:hypothetical protein
MGFESRIRKKPIPDPGSRGQKPDPGSGSATGGKSNTATSPQCLSCCRVGVECACAAPGRQDGQVQAPLDCHPRAHLFSLPRSLRVKIQVTPSGNFITENKSHHSCVDV